MKYKKRIDRLRKKLTAIIIGCLKNNNNHINALYVSTGIPWTDHDEICGEEEQIERVKPLHGFCCRGDESLYLQIEHLSLDEEGKPEITVCDVRKDSNFDVPIEDFTLETLCDIVLWLEQQGYHIIK